MIQRADVDGTLNRRPDIEIFPRQSLKFDAKAQRSFNTGDVAPAVLEFHRAREIAITRVETKISCFPWKDKRLEGGTAMESEMVVFLLRAGKFYP